MRGLPVASAFLSLLLSAALLTGQAPLRQPVFAHFATSTASAEAQRDFDAGLTLLYAFNPQEARRRFERALAADPGFAMAHWGMAMSWGVNINTSFDPASQLKGKAEIGKAKNLEGSATPPEVALIDAATVRFAHTGKNDGDASATAYADAMVRAAERFPENDEIQVQTAEAEMDATPWDYWTASGKPANPRVPDIVARLETVLAHNPNHLQANHLLIHALEESPHPEGSLHAADRLAADTFEPGAEHMTHMPAHTYMRTGDYHAAGVANTRAIDMFDAYLTSDHAPGHEGYRAHDCHFAVTAYMMSGEESTAAREAKRCDGNAGVLSSEVAVRFRHYGDLASRSDITPFAHGMASVAAGHLHVASLDAKSLGKMGDDVASIAAGVLEAAIARANAEHPAEITALERAVKLQDAEGYGEPPSFFFPVRESLGGALLRAGRPADAAIVFRADLERNPGNPRSLFGLAAALRKTGNADEAARVDASFVQAWRYAAAPLDINDL
jgi:tetratricopeptide (TPR) repeat protein